MCVQPKQPNPNPNPHLIFFLGYPRPSPLLPTRPHQTYLSLLLTWPRQIFPLLLLLYYTAHTRPTPSLSAPKPHILSSSLHPNLDPRLCLCVCTHWNPTEIVYGSYVSGWVDPLWVWVWKNLTRFENGSGAGCAIDHETRVWPDLTRLPAILSPLFPKISLNANLYGKMFIGAWG